MGGVGPVCAVGVGGGSSRCCGTGDSRIAPTAGVGRTRAGVMRELLVVEGPSTGSGRTDSGSGPTMGSRGMRWGTETSPRLAPALGSRESGNDDGGCGGMRWREGLVSGWGPALAGGRFENRPYDRVGRTRAVVMRGLVVVVVGPSTGSGRTDSGCAPATGWWGMRWGTETPRAAPLWIPAFAGMTRVGGPLRVSSGQASTGLGRMDWGSACATRWGVVVGRRYASGFLAALEVEWGAMAGRRARVVEVALVGMEDVLFRGGWLS